jgi:hypothetical protein
MGLSISIFSFHRVNAESRHLVPASTGKIMLKEWVSFQFLSSNRVNDKSVDLQTCIRYGAIACIHAVTGLFEWHPIAFVAPRLFIIRLLDRRNNPSNPQLFLARGITGPLHPVLPLPRHQ